MRECSQTGLLLVLASFAQTLGFERPSKQRGMRVIAGVVPTSADDMRYLSRVAETGAFRPVIDRCYPWSHAAEAHAHVEAGHKRGNVVMSVA